MNINDEATKLIVNVTAISPNLFKAHGFAKTAYTRYTFTMFSN